MARAAAHENLRQGGPSTENVGFDFGERNAHPAGDLIVGLFFKMVEHQRHPLMVGQLLQRPLDPGPAIDLVEVGEGTLFRLVL